MRTTVELSDAVRAKLLELAARRGERGFSALVEEAVTRFLDEDEERCRRADDARDVIGTMSEEDADALAASVETLRGSWR